MTYTSKKPLSFVLFILVCFSSIEGYDKLQLNFDVNNTLIAKDKLEGKSSENVINHYLSKKYVGIWRDEQKTPMSYYEFIHQIVVPGDRINQELKKIRRNHLNEFVEFLNKSHHPLAKEVNDLFTNIMTKLETRETSVFESFFKLLNYLDQNTIEYSIILRSYGNDLKEVAEEIENYLNRKIFTHYSSFNQGILHHCGNKIYDGRDIYQIFSSGQHYVIHDDWLWWHTHGENPNYGKPFYIDESDKTILEIFLDDNIKDYSSPTNIVAPISALTNRPLHIKELIEKGQIVKVETIDAIMDDDYFIKKIIKAKNKD